MMEILLVFRRDFAYPVASIASDPKDQKMIIDELETLLGKRPRNMVPSNSDKESIFYK